MPFCLWKAKNDSVSNFLLVQKLECRLLTAKSRSVRGASCQPAFMGSCLTICPTCLPCPHLLDRWGYSPGIGSGNKETEIWNSAVLDRVVVMMLKSCRGNAGSIPRRSQTTYLLLPQKWCVETTGEGDHDLMCRGRQLSLPEWGKLTMWKGVTGLCWRTVEDE